MKKLLACGLVVAASLSSIAMADELIFRNGDRVHGIVTAIGKSRIKVKTENFGEQIIDLEKVQEFYTDGPVSLLLEDGTASTGMKVLLWKEGYLHLAPAEVPATFPTTEPTIEPTTGQVAQPTTRPAIELAELPAADQSQPASAGVALDTPETMPATTSPAAPPEPPPGTVRIIRNDQLVRMASGSGSTTQWSGSMSAGATLYRGNTNSETLTLAYDFSRRTLKQRLESNGIWNYGREKAQGSDDRYTTANNLSIYGEYNYFVRPKWYLYAGSRFEQDRLQKLMLRATPGGGIGYQWLETDNTSINTEAGLNWVYERRYSPHEIQQYSALRAAWHVSHSLNDRVKLTHNFEILPRIDDFSDYVANADAGLRVSMTGRVFTELRIVFTYDSTPGEEQQSTDISYHAMVGYSF